MTSPLRSVDSPATPVASWRPGPARRVEDEWEENTARIPDVVRLLAMSIGADEDLLAGADSERSLPPAPLESGVVPKVGDVTDDVTDEAPTSVDSLVLPLLRSLSPIRPPAFAFPSAPEVDNEPDPAPIRERRRLARTVASAILAAGVLFLLAVVGTKPYFLAARVPHAMATRVDPRADRLAVKRPQPIVVTVPVAVPAPRAVARASAPAQSRRGIIRVAPF